MISMTAREYYDKYGEQPKRITASGSSVPIPISMTLQEFQDKFGSQKQEPTAPEPSTMQKIGAFVGNLVSHPMQTIDTVGNFIGGSIVNTYKDTVLQGESDKISLETIAKNNSIINGFEKKKKENPSKSAFYDEQIQKILQSNKEISSNVGGDIKNKTDEKLRGQALGTAVDIAGILAPVEGLIKNAGKMAITQAIKRYGVAEAGTMYKEGLRLIGEEGVAKMTQKAGGVLTEDGINTILHTGMESLGKNGLLKGDKLLSVQGVKNIISNPLVSGGMIYGGAQGLSQGMQNNEGALGLAKSTIEGTVYGVGGGIALHTIGKIIGGATRSIVNKVAEKRAGADSVAEARNAIQAAEDLLGHKLGRTEAKQITTSVFKGATRDDIIKSIAKEADVAGVNLDTSRISGVVNNERLVSEIGSEFDVPSVEKSASEISVAKTVEEKQNLIPSFVPESERPALAKRLENVSNPDEVANIIDGYNPEAIMEKLAEKIAVTDNPKVVEKLVTGVVPEKDIQNAVHDLSNMKDPQDIAKVISSYKEKPIEVKNQNTETSEVLKEQVVPEQKNQIQTYEGTGKPTRLEAAHTFNEHLLKNGESEIKDIPEHSTINFKAQEDSAKKIFSEDPEKLLRIATMEEHSNDVVPVIAAKVIVASDDKLLKSRLLNSQWLRDLAERARTTGQENAAFAALKEDDPIRIAGEILDSRMKDVEPEKIPGMKKQVKKEIDMEKVQISIQKAQKILDDILCK